MMSLAYGISIILLTLTMTGVGPHQTPSATIAFHARDFWTANSDSGVSIQLSGPVSMIQLTDQNGNTTFSLPFGTYNITVTRAQCTQIGPQSVTVDENAPSLIIAKIQCPPSGSPPLVTPHLQTDGTQYEIGQVITWTASGFAPGAYLQPCLGNLCGAVVQSSSSGIYQGIVVVDARVSAGNQTLSVNDIMSDAVAQIQVLILS